jgi:hypothetical protein
MRLTSARARRPRGIQETVPVRPSPGRHGREEEHMRAAEFRALLTEYPYTDDQMAECVRGVERLEEHLAALTEATSLDEATSGHMAAFAAQAVAHGSSTRRHFVGIYFYAGMIGNHDLQVAVLELLDGFEILGNLHRAVGEELGEEAQARVFDGIELPTIGATPLQWTRLNAVVFPRLQAIADADTVKRILRSGLRDLPDSNYLPIKERYEEIGDIEPFLDDRGRQHLELLTRHRDEGTPYFNQMIDDDVVDFVAAHPEIGRGVRRGDTIIEIKIPHQAIEYLAAPDLATKQYRVCHCPLVKESMAHDDIEISPAFCDFCPSFNAKPWEVIFERKLDYDVLESAKRGGKWCKFAIHLPQGVGG